MKAYYKKALRLSPYLGKPVKSVLKSDPNTDQILVGLDRSEEYWDHWFAKIQIVRNGVVVFHHVSVSAVQQISEEDKP